MMELEEFLEHVATGGKISAGSESMACCDAMMQDALRITMELNGVYHTPEEVRELFGELTGRPVGEGFLLVPPFHTDFGRNIIVGESFINAGCMFQDQGGITIGDGCLIGHRVVLVTLNHGMYPEDRGSLYPAPIAIGDGVWIGSGAIVCPGVRIGDNAVVGAGAVVTRDVAADTVVAGVPAKFMRDIV